MRERERTEKNTKLPTNVTRNNKYQINQLECQIALEKFEIKMFS